MTRSEEIATAPGAAAMREAEARAVEKLYRTEPDKIDDGYDTEQVGHRVRKRYAAAIRARGEREEA